MKRLLPILPLFAVLIATDAAAASWQRYARNAELTRYFDPVRRVVMSGMAIVWDLHDLANESLEQGKPVRSVLYPTEFNCRHLRLRVLSEQKMAGNMGSGDLVSEQTVVGEWREVRSGSTEEKLMNIACGD